MLAVLIVVICILIVLLAVAIRVIFITDREVDSSSLDARKFCYMFKVMDQWMQALHAGKSMEQYLIDTGYKEIAVYGMHYIGERLLEELAGSKVTVAYAIDKNREMSNHNINVFKPTDELPTADLIVVTTALYFYDIRKELQERVTCPIISIEELIERMV